MSHFYETRDGHVHTRQNARRPAWSCMHACMNARGFLLKHTLLQDIEARSDAVSDGVPPGDPFAGVHHAPPRDDPAESELCMCLYEVVVLQKASWRVCNVVQFAREEMPSMQKFLVFGRVPIAASQAPVTGIYMIFVAKACARGWYIFAIEYYSIVVQGMTFVLIDACTRCASASD